MTHIRRARLALLVPAIAVVAALAGPAPGSAATPHLMAGPSVTPTPGGTLDVRSSSGTDYLDPNVTWYSYGYSFVREFSRGLYSWPAVADATSTAAPDLATAAPDVSPDGLTYRVTIRDGAMWNTAPPRQVTAADAIRGLKVTCNPFQPFGGIYTFGDLIQGMHSFCRDFARVNQTARAIRRYVNHHEISGVSVDSADPQTVVFTLKHRADHFRDVLALPAFSPRAKEAMNYIPASLQFAAHTISDGPYQVQSYRPMRKIVYVRNPAWNSATDTIHAAYVDKIVVRTGASESESQRRLEQNDETTDLSMDSVYPLGRVAAIEADPSRADNLSLNPTLVANPYLLFNTASPNNHRALAHVKVRRALSYALNRPHMLKGLAGGIELNPPLTHVLPGDIVGSQPFDLYPYDPAKAQSILSDAGVQDLTLTFLYRPSSPSSVAVFKRAKHDLADVGVTVVGRGAQDADFYTKYLQDPSSARAGKWDLSLAGWGPDWYHDAAYSFFGPLFDGRTLPPTSSDFGLFDDPDVDAMIDAAVRAPEAGAAAAWHDVDVTVMHDAPFFPLTEPARPMYRTDWVNNAVFVPGLQGFDFTNVWLDPAHQG